jgi:hypothetical protein
MNKRIGRLPLAACLSLLFGWSIPARAQVTLDVLNPRGVLPARTAAVGVTPRISDLSGKRVGLIANYKAGADLFLSKIEEVLKNKVPTATVVRLRMGQGSNADYKGLADKVDVFIHATGD